MLPFQNLSPSLTTFERTNRALTKISYVLATKEVCSTLGAPNCQKRHKILIFLMERLHTSSTMCQDPLTLSVLAGFIIAHDVVIHIRLLLRE